LREESYDEGRPKPDFLFEGGGGNEAKSTRLEWEERKEVKKEGGEKELLSEL
jgi:hypothetical protein